MTGKRVLSLLLIAATLLCLMQPCALAAPSESAEADFAAESAAAPEAQQSEIPEEAPTEGEIELAESGAEDSFPEGEEDLVQPLEAEVELMATGDWVTVDGIVGGQICFDSSTGTITDCETTVTAADIPSTIGGVSVTSIGDWAFAYCTSLTSVSIPDSVTSIGNFAFSWCTSLISVSIPDSVTSIGDWAFYLCTSLTSVSIPDSVTSIGDSAFAYCTSLTSVSIPDSVTSIEIGAFENCTSLTDVYYAGSADQWGKISIGGYNTCLTHARIHYNGSDESTTVGVGFYWYLSGTAAPIQIDFVELEIGSLVPYRSYERAGYRFVGWYANANCTGSPWNFATDRVTEAHLNGLNLWAKYEERESFSQLYDVLPFDNNGGWFCSSDYWNLSEKQRDAFEYEISDADYSILQDNLSWYNLVQSSRLKNEKKSSWAGSCFGMSAVAVLMYNKRINPLNYGGTSISDLDIVINSNGSEDVGKVESLVNHYYLMQFIGEIEKARNNYNPSDESQNLQKLVSKLLKNECVVLGLNLLNKGSGELKGGHAVVAYGMTANEDNTVYTIKIYDCSLSIPNPFTLTITKNGGTYSKACSAWENKWGYNIFVKYAITSDDFTGMTYRLMDEIETEPQEYELTTNFDSFTVSDGTNTVSVVDGEIDGEDRIGITLYGNQNEPGFAASYLTILPALDIGSYTITPTALAEEEPEVYELELYCDHSTKGFFHAVELAQPASVTIGADGTLTTQGEEAAEQSITSAYNGSDIGVDGVTYSGSSTGFTTALMNGEVRISSASETEISLSVSSGLKEQSADDITLTGSESISLQSVEDDDTACKITQGDEVTTLSLGHVVVYDSCGGSTVASETVECGRAAVRPTDPVYEGYVFENWYTDEELTVVWDFETEVTEDLILYAGWTRDPDYWKTVTFRADGFSDQVITVASGTQLTEADIPEGFESGLVKVKWDSEALEKMITEPLIEDMEILGIVCPNYDGTTLSMADTELTEGILSLKLVNHSEVAFAVRMIAGAYDAAGRLICCSMETVSLAASGTAQKTCDFSKVDNLDHVKVFLVEDNAWIMLCDAESVRVSE